MKKDYKISATYITITTQILVSYQTKPKSKSVWIRNECFTHWGGSSRGSEDVRALILNRLSRCEHGTLISQRIDLFSSSACLRPFTGDCDVCEASAASSHDWKYLYLSLFSLRSHPYAKTHAGKAKSDTAFKFPKTAMPTYSHRQRKAHTSVSDPIDRRAYLINK